MPAVPIILAADDDVAILKVIEFRLKKEGYSVIVCHNGKDAYEQIRDKNPALILTDVMMPFMSGLELVSSVRNELKLNTPILLLSAVGLENTVVEAFKLGADDFITKPFSPNELSIRVAKYLRRTA